MLSLVARGNSSSLRVGGLRLWIAASTPTTPPSSPSSSSSSSSLLLLSAASTRRPLSTSSHVRAADPFDAGASSNKTRPGNIKARRALREARDQMVRSSVERADKIEDEEPSQFKVQDVYDVYDDMVQSARADASIVRKRGTLRLLAASEVQEADAAFDESGVRQVLYDTDEADVPVRDAELMATTTPDDALARASRRDFLVKEVLSVGRHIKVTANGRMQTFSVIVVLGDGNGTAGFGYGKALNAATATVNAARDAEKCK